MTAITTFKFSRSEFYRTSVDEFLALMFLYSERMSNNEKSGNLSNEDYKDLKDTIDKMKAKKEAKIKSKEG